MRVISSLLALMLLSACGAPTTMARMPVQQMAAMSAPRAVTTISVAEAHDWLADPNASWTLIDLRTPAEFATGHLQNASNLNFYATDFRAKLEGMNRHQPIIMYCQSGNRSGKALEMMREMGFRNVYDIKGGILAWQAAGYAIASR